MDKARLPDRKPCKGLKLCKGLKPCKGLTETSCYQSFTQKKYFFFFHNRLDFQYRTDTIGRFLYDYGEKFILSALEDGEYAIAARNYLQMLESLTRHFIVNEHWGWFDDLYSPDYTVSRIWDKFIPHIRSGALAGECLEELETGLAEIKASEALSGLSYAFHDSVP